MAEFDRAFLEASGVPEEAIEAVLRAHEAAIGAAVEGMVSEGEAQARIEAAVQAAVEGLVSEEEAKRRVDEAVSGLLSEEEAQARIEAALEAAEKGVDEAAYRQLEAERDMLRAIGGEAFEGVKPKFREQVYALLDRGAKASPIEAQLEAIREQYEEYFIGAARGARLPRFGGPTRGSMPRGAIGAAEQFSQAWGFGPRRES